MIPTLVIGLREGLEASLIVGIIAAFLNHAGRRDALKQVWLGVGAAVLLCLAVGVALFVLSRELPQRAQEGLETVVGLFALLMVTFMIFWMTRHARSMKKDLEGATQDALASGSARALVVMAFLAVLREGFETAVFLIAVIQNSTSAASATAGAVIGLVIAVALGWGLYRGGIHLNLSRFFKVTGLVLAVVAAGLAMNAAHTAFEAGWLSAGHRTLLDLTWLVRPGTVLSSLITGVLGIQPRPTVAESVAWLVYAIPVIAYVAWPRRRPARPAVPKPARVAA
jgi:high-affinity iron transporter